jgi:hypothetical protein
VVQGDSTRNRAEETLSFQGLALRVLSLATPGKLEVGL